jgi:sulfate transport system permease protein
VASHRRVKKTPLTYVFRVLVIGYLFLLVAWPVSLIAEQTFADGFDTLSTAFGDEEVTSSLLLTARVAFASVLINLVFGVGISLLLTRYQFPGRRLLSALIDVPLSVSPVVVGLSLMLVYGGREGWFGPGLEDAGFQIIFATPGIIMATTFVALPLVIREVVPVLEEIGTDAEQAARSLGANAVQTFRRITLPAIKWAVVYGVVLCLARSLGEFGAVKVVAGNVGGKTRTATLAVEHKYQQFGADNLASAYAIAFLLAAAAVVCITVVSLLRPDASDRRT